MSTENHVKHEMYENSWQVREGILKREGNLVLLYQKSSLPPLSSEIYWPTISIHPSAPCYSWANNHLGQDLTLYFNFVESDGGLTSLTFRSKASNGEIKLTTFSLTGVPHT